MEFCVLEPVEPPQRMERSDGYIRNVYMQGWMTMDHYEVYSDFLANVHEQHLRELEPGLGRCASVSAQRPARPLVRAFRHLHPPY